MSRVASVQTFGNKSTQNLVINLYIVSQINGSVKFAEIFFELIPKKKQSPEKSGLCRKLNYSPRVAEPV